MNLKDFGATAREARLVSGLTQSQLAAAVGVSRATINYVENGTQDVAFSTVASICEALGLRLEATPGPHSRRSSSLEWIVTSANTSYRNELTIKTLSDALVAGSIEEEFYPHLAYIINEVSQPRQIQMIKEIAAARKLNPKVVLRNFKTFAEKLGYSPASWLHA